MKFYSILLLFLISSLAIAANKLPKLENGTLYVFFGKHKCEVTKGVSSFKNAQHPKDVARGYYVKDGDLYVLNDISGSYDNCPKARVYSRISPLVREIKEYSTVPGKESHIVNFTLDQRGRLIAWGYKRPVFDLNGIVDYAHGCFNEKGKSFSSVLAFAIDRQGRIYKVRKDGYDEHKGERYDSIKAFKKDQNVCK